MASFVKYESSAKKSSAVFIHEMFPNVQMGRFDLQVWIFRLFCFFRGLFSFIIHFFSRSFFVVSFFQILASFLFVFVCF